MSESGRTASPLPNGHVEAVRREGPGRVAAPLAGDSSAPDDDDAVGRRVHEPAYGLEADPPQVGQVGSCPGGSSSHQHRRVRADGGGHEHAAEPRRDPITLTSCLNASVSSLPPT